MPYLPHPSTYVQPVVPSRFPCPNKSRWTVFLVVTSFVRPLKSAGGLNVCLSTSFLRHAKFHWNECYLHSTARGKQKFRCQPTRNLRGVVCIMTMLRLGWPRNRDSFVAGASAPWMGHAWCIASVRGAYTAGVWRLLIFILYRAFNEPPGTVIWLTLVN